jgi:anthranilate/para-aminobenzoate synthase component II
MSEENMTLNRHNKGITVQDFLANKNMTDFFKVTSTSVTDGDVHFIYSMEATRYPIYGIMYHPEYPLT